MNRFLRIFVFVLALIAVSGIQPAYALSSLFLSDGVGSVLIEDGSGLDSHSNAGVVTYVGPVGGFEGNVATGITYPVVGSPEFPNLDLNDVSYRGAGTLTIMFSQTDYVATGNSLFTTAIGGATDGTVTAQTYLDISNTLFGTGTLLADLGPFSNAFDGTVSISLDPSVPYSLTTVATITHTNTNQVSSFDLALLGSNPVPEPTSLMLLLSGGAFLTRIRIQRKKKKA